MSAIVSEYDFDDDLSKSIEFCYAVIRKRKAAGGPGWEGPRMRYVLNGTVTAKAEEFLVKHVSGAGDKATFARESLGWRVSFKIAEHYIGFVFPDEPELEVGDFVKMTLEKQ